MSQALLEELANAVAERLRAHGATQAVVVDLPASRVRVTQDGTMYEVFLGNAYDEYVRAAPGEERAAIVEKYVHVGPDMRVAPPTADEWNGVLPKVTPRRERELLKLRFGELANVNEGVSIADVLIVELAIDLPQRIRIVQANDLAASGMTEAEALERAKQNLRARSSGPWLEVVPGLYQSPWADFFDAARIAVPDVLPRVKGDPIVVLANRCAMLVTGSGEEQGLRALYPATRVYAKNERPVYLGALRLVRGAWRTLGDADMDLVKLSPELLFLSSLQDALDHEVLGERIAERLHERGYAHVQPLRALDREGAPLMTVAVLEKPNVIIPKADLVVIGETPIAWYKLEAALGKELVAMEGVWPPHFLVRRVPVELQ